MQFKVTLQTSSKQICFSIKSVPLQSTTLFSTKKITTKIYSIWMKTISEKGIHTHYKDKEKIFARINILIMKHQ